MGNTLSLTTVTYSTGISQQNNTLSSPAPSQSSSSYYLQGQSLWHQGKYAAAEDLFRKMFSAAVLKAADFEEAGKRLTDPRPDSDTMTPNFNAIAYFLQAKELGSRNPEIYARLGALYELKAERQFVDGKAELALAADAYNRAINYGNTALLSNLATVYSNKNYPYVNKAVEFGLVLIENPATEKLGMKLLCSRIYQLKHYPNDQAVVWRIEPQIGFKQIDADLKDEMAAYLMQCFTTRDQSEAVKRSLTILGTDPLLKPKIKQFLAAQESHLKSKDLCVR